MLTLTGRCPASLGVSDGSSGITRSSRSSSSFLGTLIALQLFFDYKAELYRNSPEGKAAAAAEVRRAEYGATIDVAKIMVRSRLRDPSNAEFMGIRVSRRDGKAVCSFVNSRNGLGGMAGDEWFVVVGAQVHFVSSGAAAYAQIKRYCG
jgi:hypothetical protein